MNSHESIISEKTQEWIKENFGKETLEIIKKSLEGEEHTPTKVSNIIIKNINYNFNRDVYELNSQDIKKIWEEINEEKKEVKTIPISKTPKMEKYKKEEIKEKRMEIKSVPIGKTKVKNIEINKYVINFLKQGPKLNKDENNQIKIFKYMLEQENIKGVEEIESDIENVLSKTGKVIINTKRKGLAQLNIDNCFDIMYNNPKKFREIVERLIHYGDETNKINNNEMKALKILYDMSNEEMKSQKILDAKIPKGNVDKAIRVVKIISKSESVYTDYDESTHAYALLYKLMNNDIIATVLTLNVISHIKDDIISRYGITNLDSDINLNFLAIVQYNENEIRADNFRTQFMMVRIAKKLGIKDLDIVIDGKFSKDSTELYNKICLKNNLKKESGRINRRNQLEKLYEETLNEKMILPKVNVANIKYGNYYRNYYNTVQDTIRDIVFERKKKK